MALGNNPAFSQVRAFFAGPANLAAYVRGGAYVPNIGANAAISTTVAGLRLSQFSGADKVTLPPAPYITDMSVYATHFDAGEARAEVFIRSNGTMVSRENNGAFFTLFTWLPAGRSASEYQFRVHDGLNWAGWITVTGDITVAGTSAYSDGFYSDSAYFTGEVQLGAQGTPLTAAVGIQLQADAIGRG